MKQQMSFAPSGYAGKMKVTRRERVIGETEQVVLWTRLCAVIDAITLLKFEHLLEAHGLGRQIFEITSSSPDARCLTPRACERRPRGHPPKASSPTPL